jgi:hypothetical protein
MSNEFQEALDGAARLVRGIATFVVIAVWIVMTAGGTGRPERAVLSDVHPPSLP